jgi:coproporphyrinogen III oxidase
MTNDVRGSYVIDVGNYLKQLQDSICAAFEAADPGHHFREDLFSTEMHFARPRVLSDGAVFEKAVVNFSQASARQLPPAALQLRPQLADRSFDFTSLSVIAHPANPFVPAAHANLRFFEAPSERSSPEWWFGGGLDLSPCYGFEEDAIHWHRNAYSACKAFGSSLYSQFKRQCDDYFFLPHRGEPRGIGGLFFDNLQLDDVHRTFALIRSIGNAFLPGYLPIVLRRKDHPFGPRERAFQLYRRGRYVEFNLLCDRGTLFGLQSGRRVESVLAALPPVVAWTYQWHPDSGSEEERLCQVFLKAKDWLATTSDEVSVIGHNTNSIS